MPSSIPYDPSLVLGQLIDTKKVAALQGVAAAQKPKEITKLDQAIKFQAGNVVRERIKAYDTDGTVAKAWGEASLIVNSFFESPVDFTRTQIQNFPLSSNSINFDTQYFSFDKNDQSANLSVGSLKSFLAASTSFLGQERSAKLSTAAARQTAQQIEKHDVIGTLVISANCTHENAKLLLPMVLDPERSVSVYNQLDPADDKILGTLEGIQKVLKDAESAGAAALKKTINLLSGMTAGSSFVGMVHVLRSEKTDAYQKMQSVSTNIQAQMKGGAWFAHMNGGFGVDASFANDVKELLSTQEISSHCSCVSLGVIPSIKSNQVQARRHTSLLPNQL